MPQNDHLCSKSAQIQQLLLGTVLLFTFLPLIFQAHCFLRYRRGSDQKTHTFVQKRLNYSSEHSLSRLAVIFNQSCAFQAQAFLENYLSSSIFNRLTACFVGFAYFPVCMSIVYHSKVIIDTFDLIQVRIVVSGQAFKFILQL